MSTKEKIKYWLNKHPHLKDDDNKLCVNIWNDEMKEYICRSHKRARDFFALYSAGKLSSAPSIKRIRALLQSKHPELRGDKFNNRISNK
tara:strand:+ start:8589 stop:8855 length:267 start_codon:yes stop_codon:yes gene_type:complete